jgi:hypothetical protein
MDGRATVVFSFLSASRGGALSFAGRFAVAVTGGLRNRAAMAASWCTACGDIVAIRCPINTNPQEV